MEVVRGFVDFDEKGNLPFGIYKCTLNEFENKFVKGLSEKRNEIMGFYKKHLDDIKNCEYVLCHWIDGSFVTIKENPEDIDTLTELEGVKYDEGMKKEVQEKFDKIPDYTHNYCHSFCIFKYPEENKKDYEIYISAKSSYLTLMFGKDKSGNPKGVVELDLDRM